MKHVFFTVLGVFIALHVFAQPSSPISTASPYINREYPGIKVPKNLRVKLIGSSMWVVASKLADSTAYYYADMNGGIQTDRQGDYD